MVQVLKTPEERGKLFRFGPIEIGLTAAFGGLGLAINIMRISIPIGGGLTFSLIDTIFAIAAIIGGPWVGAIANAIVCIEEAMFLWALTYTTSLSIPLGLAFHYLRRPYYYIGLAAALLVFIGIMVPLTDIFGFAPWYVGIGIYALMWIPQVPIVIVVLESFRRYSGYMRRLIDGAAARKE